MSDILLKSIEKAVNGDPDNHDLRAHFADLLFEAGSKERALAEAAVVLGAVPDHLEALRVAARSAEALGEGEKAKRYRRLLFALSDDTAVPEAAAVSDVPATEESSAKVTEEPPKVVTLRVMKGGADSSSWAAEKVEVKLADVAGLDAVKRRLELGLFAPLRNPEMRKMFGRSVGGGLLLFGPPGCGKTFIARATAGELGARFLSAGLHDVLDMYLGQSERRLHELFETARRSAPCVLFIDEIDALGRKRSLQRESAGRDVVNQLLAELDSMGSNNDGLFVLAATNHPWDVDSALRRPGRFDRMIFAGPPDAEARRSIIEFHMRGRTAEGVDVASIAAKTLHYSGADLAHLCDTAAEYAMEDSLKSGAVRPIGQKDFVAAIKDVKPSTRAWLETARNYAMFANEGGSYDDLIEYLRASKLM